MQEFTYEASGGSMTGDAVMSGYAIAVAVAAWLFFSFMQYRIAANKTGNADIAWWAFIPVANTFLLIAMAGQRWSFFLLLLVPFVNIIAFFYLWVKVADNCYQSKFWGAMVMFPFINVVAMIVLAYGSRPYRYPGDSDGPQRKRPTPERVIIQ